MVPASHHPQATTRPFVMTPAGSMLLNVRRMEIVGASISILADPLPPTILEAFDHNARVSGLISESEVIVARA